MNKAISNFLNELDKSEQKYFTKTEIHELILRSQSQDRFIKSNDIVLDRAKHTIQFKEAEPVQLERLTFKLLSFLIANENEAVDRDTILKEVWGDDVVVINRTIDVAIWKLRQIVGNRIHTIKKVGYMLKA